MTILHFDELDSTNDELKRRLLSDNPPADRTVVITDHQTAGRGRSGHEWITSAGVAMTSSMLIYTGDLPVDTVPMLTILAAMAVSDSVEDLFPLYVSIKWPNDLLLSEKKFCGILCERIDEAVIIGIGVNLFPGSYPGDLFGQATCISEELDRETGIDKMFFCKKIWNNFLKFFDVFSSEKNLSFLLEKYNNKLINAGRRVKITEGNNTFEAEAYGIDKYGKLFIKNDKDEILCIGSGEVCVRGIDGYV